MFPANVAFSGRSSLVRRRNDIMSSMTDGVHNVHIKMDDFNDGDDDDCVRY